MGRREERNEGKMNKVSVTKLLAVDRSPCACYITELQAHRYFTVGRHFYLGKTKENGTELALLGSV
jgi:hypothetical protein